MVVVVVVVVVVFANSLFAVLAVLAVQWTPPFRCTMDIYYLYGNKNMPLPVHLKCTYNIR